MWDQQGCLGQHYPPSFLPQHQAPPSFTAHVLNIPALMALTPLPNPNTATGTWLDVAAEWLFGSEPVTELGQLEAAYFSDRPYPTSDAATSSFP